MLILNGKYGSARKQKIFLLESINLKWMVYGFIVSNATIDESPMAYKPMESIIENIKDTVEITKIIKSVYNFKAN